MRSLSTLKPIIELFMEHQEIEHPQLSAAVDLMHQFGGSFASSLATTFQLADFNNRVKILREFKDLFMEYIEMAESLENKDNGL